MADHGVSMATRIKEEPPCQDNHPVAERRTAEAQVKAEQEASAQHIPSTENLLELPPAKAMLAPFPPGCPVLYMDTKKDPLIVSKGVVGSVSIDLTPGSSRDFFYNIARRREPCVIATESHLQWAPSCRVWVKPPGTIPGQEWKAAVVRGSYQESATAPPLYSVQEVEPGTGLFHGVEKDSIQYRRRLSLPPRIESVGQQTETMPASNTTTSKASIPPPVSLDSHPLVFSTPTRALGSASDNQVSLDQSPPAPCTDRAQAQATTAVSPLNGLLSASQHNTAIPAVKRSLDVVRHASSNPRSTDIQQKSSKRAKPSPDLHNGSRMITPEALAEAGNTEARGKGPSMSSSVQANKKRRAEKYAGGPERENSATRPESRRELSRAFSTVSSEGHAAADALRMSETVVVGNTSGREAIMTTDFVIPSACFDADMIKGKVLICQHIMVWCNFLQIPTTHHLRIASL